MAQVNNEAMDEDLEARQVGVEVVVKMVKYE